MNRNGIDEVLVFDQYKFIDPIVTEIGGVYNRYPWFVPNIKLGEINFTRLSNGNLLFKPSDDTCQVFHLWDTNHQPIATNTSRYWMDAKIKIMGPCLIQAGMDFIRELEITHHESGASNWLIASNQYQIIRFQNW